MARNYQLRRRGSRQGWSNQRFLTVALPESPDASVADRTIHPWLSGLSLEMQSKLDKISSVRTYSRGELIFVEGKEPAGVFFLCAGRARLSATAADGKALLVRKVGPGEVIGLPAVVGGTASEVTAEALVFLECQFVPRDGFLRVVREHSAAALRVAESLSHIYRNTLQQVRYLGFSASAAGRLARFLLDSAAEDGATVRVTHKEIAAMIGASRETVTRMLARFRREQLLHFERAEMRIANRDKLEKILLGIDGTFGDV